MTEKSLIERAREYKARQDARENSLAKIRELAERMGERPSPVSLIDFFQAIKRILSEINKLT